MFVAFKGDTKFIYEYRGGKEIRTIPFEGEKKSIQQFRRDYLVVSVFEKRNEKNDTSDKFRVHIMDMKNQYFAYYETFAKVESIIANRNNIIIIGGVNKGERLAYALTERDNSFKI